MGDCGNSLMQQHQPTRFSYTLQQQQKGPTVQPQSVKSTPPPPTTNDAMVRQAREDALRQERARQGRKSTVLAGATDRQTAGSGTGQSGNGAGRITLGG